MIPSKLSRLVGPMALLIAAVLVVTLAVQNRALRNRYDALLKRERLPYPGLYMPTFRATTLDGEAVTVGEAGAGERQLLFVFNTTCPYCRASIPAWKRVAAGLDTVGAPAVRLLGISLSSEEETRRYVSAHALPFPVARYPHEKLRFLYRTGLVPQIVLLDSEGRVLYGRAGLLEDGAPLDSVLAAAVWISDLSDSDE